MSLWAVLLLLLPVCCLMNCFATACHCCLRGKRTHLLTRCPPLPLHQTPKEVDSEQVGRAAFDPHYGLDDDLDPEVRTAASGQMRPGRSFLQCAMGCLQLSCSLQEQPAASSKGRWWSNSRYGRQMPVFQYWCALYAATSLQDFGLRRNEVHDATPSVIEQRLRQVSRAGTEEQTDSQA